MRSHHFLAVFLFAAALPVAALDASPALVEEVPFITTPDNVTLEMLRIAQVAPGDHVIDLGSGDGRIVITAASRFGATGLGVEIVPDLVRKSVESARRAGVAARTTFRVQDIFETDLSTASVVTLYLLPEVNLRLRPALLALAPGTRVVSHDWDMGDWAPDETRTLDVPDKQIGREKRSRVHVWRVPAPVQGAWCAGGVRLEVTQRFQTYRAVLQGHGTQHAWDGRIEGAALLSSAQGAAGPLLRWTADGALVTARASGDLPAGTRFQRGASGRCAG